MSEITTVAVDAMGGDYAPAETVKGAVLAVLENININVILVGKQEAIEAELNKYSYPDGRIFVVNATEVIETAEHPVAAIRTKKDSSLVVGLHQVKEGKADAFVSAGNSGAILVGGTVLVGRIKGIERAPIGTIIPTTQGVSLLIDSGANADARASHLVQFAQMGSIYMQRVFGLEHPRVGIVNIGAEEEKGNALVKETFPLLKDCKDINFTGSIEAREIPKGGADVIVCDGFVGNVVLKMYEGTAQALMGVLKDALTSNLKSKLGAAMVLPTLKSSLKSFDASEYGGAPLLGLRQLVVKAHGNSKAKEIKIAILQCEQFKKQDVNGKIKEFAAKEAEAAKARREEQKNTDQEKA